MKRSAIQASTGILVSTFLFFATAGVSSRSVSEELLPPPAPKVGWKAEVEGIESSFRIRTVSVMPGESINVHSNRRFEARNEKSELLVEDEKNWKWTAPTEPGLYSLELLPESGKKSDRVQLNVFVMVPASDLKKGRLKGYSIGSYRPGVGPYSQPEGFIEVTAENEETWVSPHFQLKQFLCKQKGEFPKFMRLSEALLTKLELIVERLNQRGIPAKTLAVLSGFRTPTYNRSVGSVPNSRHLYGDAADVFLDVNEDGRMDDLNEDGRSNKKDARIFARIVEELEQERLLPVGGMGMYGNTHTHGPFIHVDARGFVARWAQS